jgi:hypothetical protein
MRCAWEPRGVLCSRCVVEIGHRHSRQPLVDGALDVADAALVLGRNQRKRRPRQLCARCTADAVYVVLRRRRHVEVDDVPERRHVDPSRRDVGRNEDPILTTFEPGKRVGALRLRPVAVDALHADFVVLEVLRQTIGAMLRAGEYKRFLHVPLVQQRQQQALLEVRRNGIDRVRNACRRQRFPLEVDHHRVVQASPATTSRSDRASSR